MQYKALNTQGHISSTGVAWIKLAVIYLIAGIGMGIMMGASENFTLRPVHTHIELLGWGTMALAGLIYTVYPQAGASRLAKLHFWLANTSLPVMAVALGFVVTGSRQLVPVLAVSELVTALGVAVFAINVFLNLK